MADRTDRALLWVLLPIAVLFAGLAPATISFAAGQAAFTLTLLILFNILAPEGWQIGLVRIEDVAIGGAVSLAVGALLWPRGAGAALRGALAEAYADNARYPRRGGAVRPRSLRRRQPGVRRPTAAASDAAAASRRLDDTFRTFLAERGAKTLPLAEATSLVTGVVGLRLAGDAVRDLWRVDDVDDGERAAARAEILADTDRVTGWYEAFAASLVGEGRGPRAARPRRARRRPARRGPSATISGAATAWPARRPSASSGPATTSTPLGACRAPSPRRRSRSFRRTGGFPRDRSASRRFRP